MKETARYYDTADYTGDALLRGTGVIGLLTGDHLHPPMVDDPNIWGNRKRWKEGAEESVRRLIRRAGITPDSRVLDVGCGVGGATRMLRREFGAKPIGLNISMEQMRTARRFGDNDYIMADVESIPIRSRSLDAVITINMFYHVRDKAGALREMLRVTKPGGVFAFDDWVVTGRVTAQDRAQLREHWNPEPVTWITDEELIRTMQDVGFDVERVDDYADVGRGVMAELFGPTFEREVRPLIIDADPQYGSAVADHLRAAIDHTISLYQQNKMRYLQIIARRP